MRLLVFFDLPTLTVQNKRAYTLFRRFLVQNGYDMLQFSVYGRVVNGHDGMVTHIRRLKSNLPPAGSVRCLYISEKQFSHMLFLVGKPKRQEKKVDAKQLLLF